MRILVLANYDLGLYNFRKELLQKLVDMGHEVYISLPYGEKVELLKKMGCQYIETHLERHGINFLTEIKLMKFYSIVMKKIKPDVILSYTIKPNLYGGIVASWLRIPYIVNVTGLGTAVEHNGILQKIVLILYKYAFRKANCIFVQNEVNKQFLTEKHIEPDKLRLIPGSGVNLTQFQVLDYPDKRSFEFVFISRIMKEKGIEHYLEAAEYINKKYPNTKFHVCGFCEEEYEARLSELHKNGVIVYHGMVSDIKGIMKKSCCTIHPTYYPEGLSNVLLESCACGRPIITTDRSGCCEVVDDGVNGYMIKQKDTKSLIDAIEKFINLPYNKKIEMGLNGRKKVENEFDRNIVIEAYLDEIRKINR